MSSHDYPNENQEKKPENTAESSKSTELENPMATRPELLTSSSRRGTAAMDPSTRQEVARKGGLAVSKNKQHMAEIGRKGGQSVSKNREHMANIGRKGGAASRGHRGGSGGDSGGSSSGTPEGTST